MQSSRQISAYGDGISRPHFEYENWYPAVVPGTVVSTLSKSGAYGDPTFGTNMKNIPGYKHGRTTHFSLHKMPDDSPFKATWWYRCEFLLDNTEHCSQTWMHVDGINYAAHIWINGTRIAAADHCIGPYRRFVFNISAVVSFDKINVCAIEIVPPQPDDLNLTFIDWGPTPPDDSMGMWQGISLSRSNACALRHPFASCELDITDFSKAAVSVSTTVVNTSLERMQVLLHGVIEEIEFSKEIVLEPKEIREETFSPFDFPELILKNPRVWWPYQLGSPQTYSCRLELHIDGALSDKADFTFGIRDIVSYINEHGSRQFSVNGKNILLRGSAWKPDLFFAQSETRDDIDIAFLKNMNLNCLRMEGMLASDGFWDKCDKEGVLVLAGWPCCNHWEKWDAWKEGDYVIANESLRSQILRLRNHPSLIAWFYGSDYPPPPNVEKSYLAILDSCDKHLVRISSATAQVSPVTGPSGVKMSGPYTFVPPVYWYTDSMPGKATSFNTETGPDVCIPIFESLKKMLPPDQLFPGSDAWNHHAGLGFFTDTEIVNTAIVKRYGKPKDTKNFCDTAQVLGYECWRAMYEAYNRNFPKGTGVIGWMLNAAWPSLLWQLYDYYLKPTGAFFGTKKACEPLHIQYSYDDGSIWVANNTFEPVPEITATVRRYGLDGKPIFEQDRQISLSPYERTNVMAVPEAAEQAPLYFLRCNLKLNGRLHSDNWYCISSDKDVFSPVSKTHFYWSLDHYADMSALRDIAKPELIAAFKIASTGREEDTPYHTLEIAVRNPSEHIAFFTRLTIYNLQTKESVSPVLWDDNYVSFAPHEHRTVFCKIPKYIDISHISVSAKVWN